MSDFSENLHLYYLQGSDPRDYRLSLELGANTLPTFHVEQFSQGFGTPNSTGQQYNVAMQLEEIPQTNCELSISLGSLNLPLSNVWFNLNIMDSNNNQLGFGSIRIEEGEQESRPINEL
jgi:hypothetical protein